MKRSIWLASTLALAVAATITWAQPPAGGPPGGPRPPLIEALDADKDGTISADELKNATTALLGLDKNKDGRLSEDEFRPPMGRGPGGGPPGASQGRRPEGQPGKEAGKAPGKDAGKGGRPEAGGPPGRAPQGGANAAGPMPPSPDQFAERALEFDADKDGKLDSVELKKFAESMAQRRGNDGPSGAGRPREPGKAPAGNAADETRSERPKHPE